MRKKLNYLFLVLVLLLCALIFSFSSDDGDQSSRKSSFVTALVLKVFVPNWNEMEEKEREALIERYSYPIRKTAHFLEYALLGFLSCGYLLTSSFSLLERNRIYNPLFAWTFSTLYAASDEIHQMFVGSRGPSVADVVLDSSGAIVGVLAMVAVTFVILRVKRRGK